MGRKKPKIPEPEVYHVEVITKARVNNDSQWEYLVKWGGYSSDANSWEPEENVKECTRLLKSFWMHIGLDDDDYDPGYQVDATAEWIMQEKEYFAAEYDLQQIEENAQQEEAEKNKAQAKPKKSLKREGARSSTASSSKAIGKKAINNDGSDSEDDEYVISTIKIPPRKRPLLISDDESTKYSEKKLKTNSSASNYHHNLVDKGKQREAVFDSPTSLFSQPSSPTPAESGYVSSRTATILHVPKHQERKANPRVKLLPLEPRQVAGGSGLSTKQRLAQSALTATSTKLKIMPARSSLMSLSFKKKPPPSNNTPIGGVDKPKSPIPLEMSAEAHPLSGEAFEMVGSPRSMTSQEYIPLVEHDPFDSFLPPEAEMQGPLPSPSVPLDPLVRAEQFLESVMPKELAAPLTTVEKNLGPVPPRPLMPLKTSLLKPSLSLPKIQKKWKWSGQLLMDVTREKSARLCNVTLSDATEHPAEGLRLSVIFSSMNSIGFSRLHDISDLDMVLRACKPVHQLAKLGPQDGSDADALKTLVRYMDKRQQVTFAPLSLDNAIVGILLVFPAMTGDLCRRFKVPGHLQQNDVLVSALFPWLLPASKRKEESRQPYFADEVPSSTLDSRPREVTLKRCPAYHRALYILRFPRWLYDHMSRRRYCLWWTPADGTKECGIETELLRSILTQCQASDVGHKAHVRIVFVHVGALKSLHKLPALAERRNKRPEIDFYTYGTHESVPSSRWGIRGIFRVGGIVTFTPSALLEDPIGVYKLVAQIVKHPLWACYLLPSAIGMVAKLTREGEDPLAVYDKKGFLYDTMLTLAEQGDISLLRPTSTRHAPLRDGDSWTGQLTTLTGRPHRLMEECIKDFGELCSNIQESGWSSAIETEISSHMLNMQCQPLLMDNFRRFVVIKAACDGNHSWDSGTEWLMMCEFHFKDNFFDLPDEIQ